MTGPDRSHTSKMTSWVAVCDRLGAVCDRLHTSKMTGQRAVCTATVNNAIEINNPEYNSNT